MTVPSAPNAGPHLRGRSAECQRLDALIAAARRGTSGTLVIRGEAGIGKSALLDYLLGHAAGCRLIRAAGVESEMELAFATLHHFCAPFLEGLERLPGPQRDALAIAFGLQAGPPPDRFLVGLATLSLLSDIAEAQPLVCLVDDVQWLDRASAQVLGFVARRLAEEAVVLVFAVREPWEANDLAGLTELIVGPLQDADARDLLAATIPGRLDEPVRERIVAESHGNPLALLELPRAWTTAALAGGFGLPDGASVSAKIEESFRRRVAPLPDESKRLLLVAAADPVGDPAVVRAAAERLGIPAGASEPAVTAGLLDDGRYLRFRHPMVRSVVYAEAAAPDRRRVHGALAEASDPTSDPDRRAWHLAAAAAGPDEEVALELERSAGRAQARGGIGAAAAFLERSLELTVDPGLRAERALAAAQTSLQAGAFDGVSRLLSAAAAGPLGELQSARASLLRANVAFASGAWNDAPSLLLEAAQRLEQFDLELARETYLTAWAAAVGAGQLSGGSDLESICSAAQALPRGDSSRPVDLLLDGLTALITEPRATAAATLLRAGRAFGEEIVSPEDCMRWGWLAAVASLAVWDEDTTYAIAMRTVSLIREVGALAHLPLQLAVLGTATAWTGDFAGTLAIIEEGDGVAAATHSRLAPFTRLRLLALQGREPEASLLIEAMIEQAPEGQGIAATNAHWAASVLFNGLGHYEKAAEAARQATSDLVVLYGSMWALPELVEAAARTGNSDLAREALDRLAQTTEPAGTDVGLGIEARCRALVSTEAEAEERYREAVDHLGRTRLRPEIARAYLLYGEWLRRHGRRLDARDQLRTAHEMFVTIGMEAFAERTRRELVATGETVRKRSVETLTDLTPQELQIARLASDGQTNPEIGAQLFLSRRTVEWHLRKVFDKLEISSRRELPAALRRTTPEGART